MVLHAYGDFCKGGAKGFFHGRGIKSLVEIKSKADLHCRREAY